ncbi:unnamed protein product, partial [Mesorhabditis belari]|uniref:Aromatic-L-amino-acid decarboxylase n=1 Tax=Mesorhabditis belari TaxID=2138241 RepID=A0AAF3J9U6_9BILA
MDSKELVNRGTEILEMIANYWETQRDRFPQPDVLPNYLEALVPSSPPDSPESWETVLEDIEKAILPGHANWLHPNFYGYFPFAQSTPSLLADLLCGGLSGVGFTWKSSPVMSELEAVVLDWLVEALHLPEKWKHSHSGPGCGIIQSTSSDSTFIAFLAARARAVEWNLTGSENEPTDETEDDPEIFTHPLHSPKNFDKLIAYCSDQAHSAIFKAAMLSGVKVRKLKSERDAKLGNYAVTAKTFEEAIKKDRALGRTPFLFVATIGTTGTCGVDHVEDLVKTCQRERIWLHVDAAYAGSFLLCPEFSSYLGVGLDSVDSFNYNAHKSMMVNFDCSPMWFTDARSAVRYFNVDIDILRHEHQDKTIDFRHLQIALGRRFRSLKLWFVMRLIGVDKIGDSLRKRCAQATFFADLIEKSDLFEMFVPPHLGLVCFRLKNSTNEENEKLKKLIDEDRRLMITPSITHGDFYFRMAIGAQQTTDEDLRSAFQILTQLAQV